MRRYIDELIEAFETAQTVEDKASAKDDIVFEIKDIKHTIHEYENTQNSTTDREFQRYLNAELETLYEDLEELQAAIR